MLRQLILKHQTPYHIGIPSVIHHFKHPGDIHSRSHSTGGIVSFNLAATFIIFLRRDIFNHRIPMSDEKSCRHYLNPLIDRTPVLKLAQLGTIILHEIAIQFIHHLIIIHTIAEHMAHYGRIIRKSKNPAKPKRKVQNPAKIGENHNSKRLLKYKSRNIGMIKKSIGSQANPMLFFAY